MTHPITPPPELVQQWDDEGTEMFSCRYRHEYQMHIATQAAQWGADQELKACCEWLHQSQNPRWAEALRAARRPKPPNVRAEGAAQSAVASSELLGLNLEN